MAATVLSDFGARSSRSWTIERQAAFVAGLHDTTIAYRRKCCKCSPRRCSREAIVAFLQEIVKRSLTDKQRRGCMLVDSAIESAPHDAEFFEVVAVFLDEVERFFFRCVSNGQKDGTITKALSAEDLSKSLLGILLGIRVLARVRPERKLLEGLLRPAFALLDNTPSPKRRKTA